MTDEPPKGSAAVRELADSSHNGDVIAALDQIADLYAWLCAEEAGGASLILRRADGTEEDVTMF